MSDSTLKKAGRKRKDGTYRVDKEIEAAARQDRLDGRTKAAREMREIQESLIAGLEDTVMAGLRRDYAILDYCEGMLVKFIVNNPEKVIDGATGSLNEPITKELLRYIEARRRVSSTLTQLQEKNDGEPGGVVYDLAESGGGKDEDKDN
ncbi:hypothetical protein [Desulfocurvibacter africanus]|uniref:hypothetical protein n=1 Tax=Desulfocurvibacter africanus TaxID=873 RepID=UPI0003FFFD4C|nr:hypothetical protein [Desulfocurvibacter africanus]